MADWNKPNNSDPNHVSVLSDLADKDTFAVTMRQAGGTFTNIPEGAMAYDNIAKLFKRLTSSVETIQEISIAGGGTGAGTAAGARTAFNVLEAGTGASQVRTNAQADAINAPLTRTIATTSPLQGGGDLSTNRTLTVDDATTAQKGVTQLNNTLVSSATDQALTAAQGKVMKDAVDDFLGSLPAVSVWTGSDSSVTDAEILADTGFVVASGKYWIKRDSSSVVHSLEIRDHTDSGSLYTGSAYILPDGAGIIVSVAERFAGVFRIREVQGNSSSTLNIQEIWYAPL